MIYQTEAVVLAVRDWRESDRMVTLFSKDQGKLMAAAYGARRPANRLSGSIQPFAHIEVSLEAGRSMDVVKQCEVKRTFREVRENLDMLTYGAFIAEVASELFPERQADPQVFSLLLAAFSLLGQRNPRLTALAALCQLLPAAGYLPEYQECLHCGTDMSFPAYFDAGAGGTVCGRCRMEGVLPIDEAGIRLLETFLQMDLREPGQFSVTGAALRQVESCMLAYLLHIMEKPLKSLQVIRQMMLR